MSPRAGITLAAILEAAVQIVDIEGVEALSLAVLAQKLNIRPPSLYNHVNGLPGLRSKLSVYGLEKLYKELTRAAVGRSGDEAVRALAGAYLAFARQHPGLYETTLRSPDLQDSEWIQGGSQVVELVMQVFRHYGMEEDTALHTVRGFRSLVHGFASLEQGGGFGMPLDLDVSFGMLVDTFLAGLHRLKE